MSAPARLLDLAVSELADELAQSPHPSLDDLAAYHRRSLSDAAAQTVQDHLVACRECTELLLDLDELAEIGREEAVPASPAEEADAEWKLFEQRLEPVAPAAPKPLPFRARPRRAPGWLQVAAAALLVATLGLSYRVVELVRRVSELEEPQINTVTATLSTSSVRGAPGRTVIRVSKADKHFSVLLEPPPGEPTFVDYGVAVTRTDGVVVLEERGLKPLPSLAGHFSLSLSRPGMPDGDYDIELSGIDGDQREVIGRYQLTVASEPTL